VSFTPFYRTETGKKSMGVDVKKRRKDSFISSFSGKPRTAVSRNGMNSCDK
jgi:hypothetical protein